MGSTTVSLCVYIRKTRFGSEKLTSLATVECHDPLPSFQTYVNPQAQSPLIQWSPSFPEEEICTIASSIQRNSSPKPSPKGPVAIY